MQKTKHSESFGQILSYWLPDVVTVFVTVALPPLFDSYFIAGYKSTTMFGAIGMAANFLHIIIKFSEAIPVAAMALIGRHNGAQEHHEAGKKFVSALWTAGLMATLQLIFLVTCAHGIYAWLGVPADMAAIGTPFLRLRALDLFLAFILYTIFGFMRSLKNTKTPMLITMSGALCYLLCASILIPGRFGIPGLGLYGAAISALVQNSLMLSVAIWFLRTDASYKPYLTNLNYGAWSWHDVKSLLSLSGPIVIDKASLAFTYVWLAKMIAPAGALAIASFDIIKNLERTAFMPAAAFAQVLTFLVSNHLGARDGDGAQKTMNKTMILTLTGAAITLGALSAFPSFFISFIAPKPEVIEFTAPILRWVNVLALFDFVQLIFASTLRGSGSMRSVMWIRFACCALFFLPISYILACSSFSSTQLKVGLIYGAFFANTLLMSALFFWQIAQGAWKHIKLNH